jgi:PAS domain S-box-containing protein
MTRPLNHRQSDPPDGLGRGPATKRLARSVWTYARPAVVLIAGLAFSTYAFWIVAESAQRNSDVAQRFSPWSGPYAVLLGGCALTLFSTWCCRPWADRSPSQRQTSEPSGRARFDRGEALCGSEEALSQILQGTSIPLFVIDRRHVVIHWNRACENLTGVRAHEIIGTQEAWRAFYAEKRPVLADLVVDRRPREAIVERYGAHASESAVLPGAYEIEALFPNFGEGGKWLFFTAAPLRDRAGAIVGAIETFQDTTERKRAETALRESEGRLQAILDSVEAGVLVLDADSHMILQANTAALRMFGAASEQVVGHECHQHICPAEKGRCPVTDLGQGVDNSERVLLNAAQGKVPVLKTVNAIVLHGRNCLLETFVDITQRKRAEEELQRRVDELSEAKRRLEVLVSNMTDRERRMVDLKREVNGLLESLGRSSKYQVPQKVAEFRASTSASAAP